MSKNRGEFTLYIGNMASRKTSNLIVEIKDLREYGRKKVAVFKPSLDTRSPADLIESTRRKEVGTIEACVIPSENPQALRDILKQQEGAQGSKFDVVAFDEVQFFPQKSGFFWLVKELLQEGYDVIVAGLALNFRGEPVGSTLWLAALAQGNCVWQRSSCVVCGEPAIFPQRLMPNGDLAPYDDPEIFVGDENKENPRHYEARCENCFVVPPRKGE